MLTPSPTPTPAAAFIPAILSKQKSLNWDALDVFSSFLTKFHFCGHSLFVDQPCTMKICHDAKEEGKGLVWQADCWSEFPRACVKPYIYSNCLYIKNVNVELERQLSW